MVEIFDKIKDAKERLIVKLVIDIIKHANRDINISEMQKKYNAYKKKTVKFKLSDKDMEMNFRVDNGKLKVVENPEKISCQVNLSSDTLISLLANKIRVIDPGTGKEIWADYDPFKAWLRGDIQVYPVGEGGTTNDAFLLFEVFNSVRDSFMVKISQKIIGAIA